eukprot:gene7350-472_t
MAAGPAQFEKRVNLTSIALEFDLSLAKGRMDALMAAGPAQFEKRVNLTSIALEFDLSLAKGRMDALMAAGPAQFEKRQKCEGEVAQMESSLQTARSEYSHMCERNLEELAKWKVDMKVDLVNMLKEFTIVQVASGMKAQEDLRSSTIKMSAYHMRIVLNGLNPLPCQVASEKKAQEMFESVVAALPPVGE